MEAEEAEEGEDGAEVEEVEEAKEVEDMEIGRLRRMAQLEIEVGRPRKEPSFVYRLECAAVVCFL